MLGRVRRRWRRAGRRAPGARINHYMLLRALLPDGRARAWLRSVAVPAEIKFCESPDDLEVSAANGASGCVIDMEAAPSAYDPRAVARAVRARSPHVCIVGYCEVALLPPERVFEWVRAGVDDVVRRDDARPYAARTQLAAAVARGEAAAVFALVHDEVPPALRDVVALALSGVREPLTPAMLARRMGLPGRTLRARLKRAGGPPPREIVQWARLLTAVERLVRTRQTVEQVADALGFASAPAFYNAVRRYTGQSVREIRASRGVLARQCFFAALTTGAEVSPRNHEAIT